MENLKLAPYSKEFPPLAPLSILNNLQDALIIFDLQGQVIFINPKFTELTGYSPHEFTNLYYEEAISLLSKDQAVYLSIVSTVKEALDGKAFYAQHKIYHQKGYSIPIDFYGSLLLNNQGNPAAVLLVIKDRHYEYMVTITNLLNSSLDIEHILHNVTRAVVEHLDLSSNAIFLLDSTENALRLVSCNVFSNDDLDKVVAPMGEGAPGIIAQTRKPLYISNLREDSRIPELGRMIHKAKSSIGFPLICRDELLGVIAFDADSIRDFSDREIQLFENISSQVALTIYNSNLLAKFERLSITDGLTEVYNHRYFQEKLMESLKMSEQNSLPLSLILIDLDHFKVYNDTFGHPKGDELLKELTGILKDSVRQSDIVCRYGGEEFAILLQGCPLNQASQIAERIRISCENHNFYGMDKLPEQRITVSIGVASFPEVNSCELVCKADQALYLAKCTRNRVEMIAK